MSITELKRNMRTQLKWIMGGIAVIFLVGAFYSFGTPGARSGGHVVQPASRAMGVGPKVMAKIYRTKIHRATFMPQVLQQLQDNRASALERRPSLMTQLLETQLQAVMYDRAAKEEKIRVDRQEREAKKDELVKQIFESQYPPDDVGARSNLKRVLKHRHMSLDQFMAELRAKHLPDNAALDEAIKREKLRDLVGEREVPAISDQQLKDSYDTVQLAQIFIAAQQPSASDSAKDHNSSDDPRAAARKKARDLLAKLQAGKVTWEQALQQSDDPPTLRDEGGVIGWRSRGQSGPEWDRVIFSLKPGEVGGPIESRTGEYIVKCLARKNDLPPDFEAKKEEYRKRLLDTRRAQAWADYQKELEADARANLEIYDKELLAYYQLQQADQPDSGVTRQQALQTLQAAAEENEENGTLQYALALELSRQAQSLGANDKARKQKLEEALPHFQRAVELEPESPTALMGLAQTYKELGQTEKAIENYVLACDSACALEDFTSYYIHLQAKQALTELGAKDKAAEVQQWLDDYQAARQSATPG